MPKSKRWPTGRQSPTAGDWPGFGTIVKKTTNKNMVAELEQPGEGNAGYADLVGWHSFYNGQDINNVQEVQA